ncbi:hypothetical protein BC835DRAFT_1292293 [Cytidiella melzeri]|nr:hypothetical protein BC835DRAFT_1292293 [Cytidiella melzeri]
MKGKRRVASKAERQGAQEETEVGTKRVLEDGGEGGDNETGVGYTENENEPPTKKTKVDDRENLDAKGDHDDEQPATHTYQTGTIERGHIYFFYRPRVELEEVHSIDDVQRFDILLVPRPPEFSIGSESTRVDETGDYEEDMAIIKDGADAVPAPPEVDVEKKPFRLIAVGKKSLPDPEAGGRGKGGGRKATFWAIVLTVGQDLRKLEDGLGAKEYETKTKGTRHQGPARIAARGAYAIVNSEGRTPSSRETHLGYHISHPTSDNFGRVQEALGIHQSSSFVLQVKNPGAPNSGRSNVGLPRGRKAQFPKHILHEVFGQGGGRGRESYGLPFASVERREMLDYECAELLLIAARSGEEGLKESLGEGRGNALTEVEKVEEKHSVESVLKELAMDAEKIPAQPLGGQWK